MSIETEALWDSFCHWTDNAAAEVEVGEEVDIGTGACACCQQFMASKCAGCPLYEYGYGCSGFSRMSASHSGQMPSVTLPSRSSAPEPYQNASDLIDGGGIALPGFTDAATDMALLLYLLYLVYGGRETR